MQAGLTGWRLVLRTALLGLAALALVCGGVLSWGVHVMSRFDLDGEADSKPDPRHLGHTDVFLVDPVDQEVRGHVVADYDGRFSKDPRWPVRLRDVEEEIPAAIRDVRDQLGLGDRPVPPFMVRFRDDEQMGFPIFMNTYQELHGNEVRPLIVVGVDSLLNRECNMGNALRHEIAHCWQLAALGDAFYELPCWVKEGMADWATGRGGDRLRELYVLECADPDRDPCARLVSGLEGGPTRREYGEFYMAFAFVEGTLGKGAVQQLASDLFTSTAYRVSFERITGLPFPEFERKARSWAEEHVRKELADRPGYVAGKAAFRKGEFEEADRAYSTYLAGEGTLHFRRIALLEQAECRIEAEDAAGARRLLDLAEAAEPAGPLNDRILHARIRVAKVVEDWAQVQALCYTFIEDFAGNSTDRTRDVRRLLQESCDRGSKAAASPMAHPAHATPSPAAPSTGGSR